MTTNTLFVCEGVNHPALFSENFFTDKPHWIDQAPEELSNRSKDQVLTPLARFINFEGKLIGFCRP